MQGLKGKLGKPWLKRCNLKGVQRKCTNTFGLWGITGICAYVTTCWAFEGHALRMSRYDICREITTWKTCDSVYVIDYIWWPKLKCPHLVVGDGCKSLYVISVSLQAAKLDVKPIETGSTTTGISMPFFFNVVPADCIYLVYSHWIHKIKKIQNMYVCNDFSAWLRVCDMKEPRYHILLCLLGTSVPEAVQDLSRTWTETCTHLQESHEIWKWEWLRRSHPESVGRLGGGCCLR